MERSATNSSHARRIGFAFFILTILLLVPLLLDFYGALRSTFASPFGLEHVEGDMALQACDFKAGYAPYPDASSARLGFLYAPLYFWVAALFSNCNDMHIMQGGRFVSLISYVGALLSAAYLVAHGLKLHFARLSVFCLASAISLSQFALLGSWYFLYRVDMLAVALALAAWAVLARSKSPGGLLVSGILFALAAATKQSFLLCVPLAACVAIYTALEASGPRRETFDAALAAVLPICAPSVLIVIGMLIAAGEPGFLYMFAEAERHGAQPEMIRIFWGNDIGRIMPVEFLLTLYFVTRLWLTARKRQAVLLLGAFLSFLLTSYLSRIHDGGFVNVTIPLALFVAACAAGAVVDAITSGLSAPATRPARHHWVLTVVALILLIVTGHARPWGLKNFREDSATPAYYSALIRLARHYNLITSDVPLVNLMAHTYDPLLGGHKQAYDIYRVDRSQTPADAIMERYPTVTQLERRLRRGYYDILVLNGMDDESQHGRDRWFYDVERSAICAQYVFIGEIRYPTLRTLMPLTGAMARPELIMARASDASRIKRDIEEHYFPLLPLFKSDFNTRVPQSCQRLE